MLRIFDDSSHYPLPFAVFLGGGWVVFRNQTAKHGEDQQFPGVDDLGWFPTRCFVSSTRVDGTHKAGCYHNGLSGFSGWLVQSL